MSTMGSVSRWEAMSSDTEQLTVSSIKVLTMDAVEAAGCGHPGMPMGMADLATILWTRFLKIDPDDPWWPDRDRFIVSNGHGSMLLYSLLHLSGFALSIDDLKKFRQAGSLTPGHPEYRHTPGVEMTTGPLGQGFATGVGMAIAEAHLRSEFGNDLVDHRTWGLISDGDLMEGVSQESASLAGHLGLGHLVYLYDDNEISIDGSTALSFSENVCGRFRNSGWQTIEVDGHDREAVDEAIREAIVDDDRPTLIDCHTHIGHGAPNKQDTSAAHGAVLGPEEVALTKEHLGWASKEPFWVPEAVYDEFREAMDLGRTAHISWTERRDARFSSDQEIADRWRVQFGTGEVSLTGPSYDIGEKLATRVASGNLFEEIAEKVPGFIGGSADLASSTKTSISTATSFSAGERSGRNIHFGIREHGMAAAVNGMALHGGLKPYASTFMVFSDYMRPAIRLSALMGIGSVWVFTHDSVLLGEDGPTHQPIEHLASLRAIPNLWVIRPADANETKAAWEVALNRTEGPTALILSRQGLPVLEGSDRLDAVSKGGYVLKAGIDLVLAATGSEVALAIDVAEILGETGLDVSVSSIPCWEAFLQQPMSYRSEVVNRDLPVVSIEAGSVFGWQEIVGSDALRIGIDEFGASAPASDLAKQFGFTASAIANKVGSWLPKTSDDS